MKIWETDTFLARWLNNELSSEEKEAFENSEDFEHFLRIKETMELYEAPEFDEDAALNKALNRIQNKPSKHNIISIKKIVQYAIAASIVVAACLSVYLTLLSDNIIEVTANIQEKLDLPDGSSIELSKGSYLKYNASDWEENRTVELKGEAFFEVEKGEPFRVQLTQGEVSVLGTSFNILEKQKSLEVICYTGKVKVEAYEKTQILKAGQSVEIQLNSIELDSVYLNEPIWVDQVASYKKVKLSKVLEQFNQWYDVSIVGQHDTSLIYTGQFPVNDIEVALEQLFGPFDIDYHYAAETKEITLLND